MSWLIVTNYQFRNPNGSLFGFFVLLDRHVYYGFNKFVNDLRQVGGYIRVLQFPPPIKLGAMI
jgi:hypothetical protein